MRSILLLVLIGLLSSSPTVHTLPQNQFNPPTPTPTIPTPFPTTTPQAGDLRVIVTPSNGSPVTVTVPAIAGLGDINRCRDRDGFNPARTAPREVFCRTLRTELAKTPSTERMARGGQINFTLETGDLNNQQPSPNNPNTSTLIEEGRPITVAVTPPAGGTLVVLKLPAVPGLKQVPAVYCRNLRLRAAEKVPSMSNIGQGGDINAQLVVSSGMRSICGVVGMVGSAAITAALWVV